MNSYQQFISDNYYKVKKLENNKRIAELAEMWRAEKQRGGGMFSSDCDGRAKKRCNTPKCIWNSKGNQGECKSIKRFGGLWTRKESESESESEGEGERERERERDERERPIDERERPRDERETEKKKYSSLSIDKVEKLEQCEGSMDVNLLADYAPEVSFIQRKYSRNVALIDGETYGSLVQRNTAENDYSVLWVRHCESCQNTAIPKKGFQNIKKYVKIQPLCTRTGMYQAYIQGYQLAKQYDRSKYYTDINFYSSTLMRAMCTAKMMTAGFKYFFKAPAQETRGLPVNFDNKIIKRINYISESGGSDPVRWRLEKKYNTANSVSFEDSQKHAKFLNKLFSSTANLNAMYDQIGLNVSEEVPLGHETKHEHKDYHYHLPPGKENYKKFKTVILEKLDSGRTLNVIVSHSTYLKVAGISDGCKIMNLDAMLVTYENKGRRRETIRGKALSLENLYVDSGNTDPIEDALLALRKDLIENIDNCGYDNRAISQFLDGPGFSGRSRERSRDPSSLLPKHKEFLSATNMSVVAPPNSRVRAHEFGL